MEIDDGKLKLMVNYCIDEGCENQPQKHSHPVKQVDTHPAAIERPVTTPEGRKAAYERIVTLLMKSNVAAISNRWILDLLDDYDTIAAERSAAKERQAAADALAAQYRGALESVEEYLAGDPDRLCVGAARKVARAALTTPPVPRQAELERRIEEATPIIETLVSCTFRNNDLERLADQIPKGKAWLASAPVKEEG